MKTLEHSTLLQPHLERQRHISSCRAASHGS